MFILFIIAQKQYAFFLSPKILDLLPKTIKDSENINTLSFGTVANYIHLINRCILFIELFRTFQYSMIYGQFYMFYLAIGFMFPK